MVLAYHRIGTALNKLLKWEHGTRYGKNLVGVFADAWKEKGGFPFGLGQAKYFRVFANAFDKQLLNQALTASIGWTALRELSGPGVSAKLRRDIVDRVSHKLLEPKDALGYLSNHRNFNPGARPTAAQVVSIFEEFIHRLDALYLSLEQLEKGKRFRINPTKSHLLKVVKFCSEVIELPDLATQCTKTWTSVVSKASKVRKKALQKMASRQRSRR
jgi:hypothetical protein